MTHRHHHHITINGKPYCDWLGTMAGREIALKSGVDTCGHLSGAAANRSAKALRPFFAHGVKVSAVPGDCIHH